MIVRVQHDVDPDTAAERIGRHGMQVQSAGADAVIAVTTPAALGRVGDEPWVTVIEEPRQLFPRSGSPERLR